MTDIDDLSWADVDARLYDLRGIGWQGEIDFYRSLAAEAGAGARVLEVACGTGRVSLELAGAGFAVTGLDISTEMLAVARRKAAGAPSPRFVIGDMRTFELGELFDLAIIPAHSFQFMLSAADQVAALRCIRAHLVAGASIAIHVDHDLPAGLVEMDGVEHRGRVISEPATGRRYCARWAWSYDNGFQTATLRTAWIEVGDRDVDLRTWELEAMAFHVTGAVEMEHALLRAGFVEPRVVGAFDGSPLVHASPDMIWTARVAPAG